MKPPIYIYIYPKRIFLSHLFQPYVTHSPQVSLPNLLLESHWPVALERRHGRGLLRVSQAGLAAGEFAPGGRPEQREDLTSLGRGDGNSGETKTEEQKG